MIAIERDANGALIDGDFIAGAAHDLAWQSHDVLQQRHAHRQETAIGEVARDGLRRPVEHQLHHVEASNRMQPVEPNRGAGSGVPDQQRHGMHQSRTA